MNITSNGSNPITTMTVMIEMIKNLTTLTITHPEVQDMMNSGEKFDAVIVTEFMVEPLKVFAHKFDAHLITFSNHAGINWFFDKIGNVIMPSCYSEMMVAFPPNMNFFQRLMNSNIKFIMKMVFDYYVYPIHRDLVKKYFPGSPELDDVVRNVSLVLVNSHISLASAQPKVPVMIEIGGFHVKPPNKLPVDLQKLLDDAKEGVIYFSMGSNFKSENLPPEKIDGILKSFSKRKEQILWKWGYETLPNKPSNIHIAKWFPQQDILGSYISGRVINNFR